MDMKISNFYATSDLPLVATLSLYFPVEKIDTTNPRRTSFLFLQTSELNDLITKYWRKELRIEPLAFFNQLKTVKTMLYSRV